MTILRRMLWDFYYGLLDGRLVHLALQVVEPATDHLELFVIVGRLRGIALEL